MGSHVLSVLRRERLPPPLPRLPDPRRPPGRAAFLPGGARAQSTPAPQLLELPHPWARPFAVSQVSRWRRPLRLPPLLPPLPAGALATWLLGSGEQPSPPALRVSSSGVGGSWASVGGLSPTGSGAQGGEGVCCSPTGRPQPSVTGPRCPPCPGEARGPAADGGQHQAGEDVAPSPMTQTLPWGLHWSLQTAAALLFPLAASPSEQGARAARTPGQGDGLPAAPGALAPSVPWVRPVWSKAPRDTQAERGAPRPGPSQQPLPPEKMTPLALQEHSLLNSHQQCLFKVPFY